MSILKDLKHKIENDVKLAEEIVLLKEENARLREALEFYADPENWILKIGRDAWRPSDPKKHGDDELIRNYNHFDTDWRGAVKVGGKRARLALEKIKEKSE